MKNFLLLLSLLDALWQLTKLAAIVLFGYAMAKFCLWAAWKLLDMPY